MTAPRTMQRPAFTLIELLVVISLLTILLAVAVPAFSGLIYSNERAQADSKLKIAATLGRDAAVRASRTDDGAVAFFFEPGGRVRAVAYTRVASLNDLDSSGDPVERDIFVQVGMFEPIELPRNWSVRGYATPNTISDDWYEDTYPTSVRDRGHWVFPETGFYNPKVGNDGEKRQTFMIRFDGGTGLASPAKARDALLLAPSTSRSLRESGVFSTYNIDRAQDHETYVRRILATATLSEQRQLLGDRSVDTVLARQVGQVALYDEGRLAGALKARLDRVTGSLYQNTDEPRLVTAPGDILGNISAWIEGRKLPGDPADKEPDREARIYFTERYSGSLREMFP